MKKKYIVYAGTILIVGILTFLHIAPVSFDAGVCGGGYRTYIAEKEMQKLSGMMTSELESCKLVSSVAEIADTITWQGRNISMALKLEDASGKVHAVSYVGKRYWIEKYDWNVGEIHNAYKKSNNK